ncbi:hypothetical protein QJS10_CPB11g02103 [Acorus calamus]|uniref:Uncharacterized protein n=1 Tax=Acorus calamus TaxID=4465 RepID=A0AAV9DQP8_ACOCL|nr:hypothetical protein QJS10_CPB11g02103 [Acorus calamus]
MVSYPRSVSLPNSNSNPNPNPTTHEKSHHVRSTSLPCRSHPTISQLHHHLHSLQIWSSKPSEPTTSAWLSQGLTSLNTLHHSLDDLLHLPRFDDLLSKRKSSGWAHNLLEDLLLFIDAYGTFRSSLMSLKELHSSAQAAMRRRDEAELGFYVKSRKKTEREVLKLLPVLRSIRRRALNAVIASDVGEVLREVAVVTVDVSVLVFEGIVTSSSLMGLKARFGLGLCDKREIREVREVAAEDLRGVVKKMEGDVMRRVLERLVVLEDCMGELERVSEGVFRGLINTRVSLLNVL